MRFFLAFLVLISHLNIRIFTLNPGVFAVIIFYILAGHVISGLWFKFFEKRGIFWFYIERFLRIYPLYSFYLFLVSVFVIVTGFGNPCFNFFNIVTNLFIVPLNYYMFLKDKIYVLKDLHWWLIPPAWSLGAELQAYFLLPYLLRRKIFSMFIVFFSFLIYSLANLNIIHSDYYGYRLLPGVLFIFYFGVYLEKFRKGLLTTCEKYFTIVIYTCCFLWLVIIVGIFKIYGAYTRETLLGIILGVPLVLITFFFNKRIPFSRLFGKLSYPLFLVHYPVIWFSEYLQIQKYKFLFVFFISLLLSFIGIYLVENPIEKIRFKLSNKNTK